MVLLVLLGGATWTMTHSLSVAVERIIKWDRADLDAFLALRLVALEVMGAGCCEATAGPPFDSASDRALAVSVDRNGDGDRADPTERIEFALAPSGRGVSLRFGRSSPQPMLDGLAKGGLRFRYFDRTGEVAGSGELCLVRIELDMELAGRKGGRPAPFTRWALARLRNGGCSP